MELVHSGVADLRLWFVCCVVLLLLETLGDILGPDLGLFLGIYVP